ncbi:MAG: helix-turn-helix domain-containing protein [Saprospiraceae bacterium]
MQEQTVKPSAFFQSASARLFRQLEFGSIIERAQQTFKEKSYLERYKNLYKAANVASFLFQALSALFAFTFSQHLVAAVLPAFGETAVLVLSCLVAGALLVGIEVFKRLCLGSFIVTLIQSRAAQSGISVSWAALAVNALLIAVSVYTSTQGAKQFTERQTDKSEQIRAEHALAADSIAAAVQKQMDAENKALADFKRSVMWKGKINVSNKNTGFTIASHNRRLERLQAEKERALLALDEKLQTDLKSNTARIIRDSGNMFWVSLLNELAGLLCIGYVFFYLSRVFIESGAAAASSRQPGQDERQENEYLQNLKAALHSNGSTVSTSAALPKNPIGFRRYDQASESSTQPADDLPPAGNNPGFGNVPYQQAGSNGFAFDKLQGFLRKYANVVRCVEEGLSNKQTAKRCRVSETTVHNVKRCLRNLNHANLKGRKDLGR